MKSPWRYRLKLVAFQWPLGVCDHVTNLRYRRREPRILVTRSAVKRAHVFHDFLTWVRGGGSGAGTAFRIPPVATTHQRLVPLRALCTVDR